MRENSLKSIRGKKIRRQYFNFPLIILFSAMIFASYAISVISIGMGKSEQYIWHDNFLTSFLVCFGFSLPFLLLRVINKNFFGRIICVLTEEGIHYPRGMLRWETIEKIEYAIDSKPRYKSDPAKSFRAIIYTRGGKHVVLESAPMCIISRAKKYKRELDVKIAGVTSLFPTVLVMTVILALIPIWIILMARAPGASTAQLVTVFVSYIALSFIKLPIFDAYSVEYRFWRRILPSKWLSYAILWFYYTSFFTGLLVLYYFPNWVVTALVGIYFGIANPPIPSTRPNSNRYLPTYERLYDMYVNREDYWKKRIENENKKKNP